MTQVFTETTKLHDALSAHGAAVTTSSAMRASMQDFASRAPQSTPSLPWPPYLVGQTAKPVRVVLVDDDNNIRHVISSELMADLRCDLVGQNQAFAAARRCIDMQKDGSKSAHGVVSHDMVFESCRSLRA